MKTHCAGLTDIGRVRERNEDNWFADVDNGLFIVSDGMGGHNSGHVASRLIVDTLPELVGKNLNLPTVELNTDHCAQLQHILTELSHIVVQQGKEQSGCFGMGATVAMLLVHNTSGLVGHMGDSRLYLYRGNQLQQITHDHSIVQYMVDTGSITEEEAESHQASNQVSQYVGMQGEPVPSADILPLLNGDRLMLCTDGLSRLLPDEIMANLIQQASNPEEACHALINAANKAGGRDNVTVIVVDIDERK